jgi:predicted DsbA family dithiol-disulfide isomerase
MPFLDFWKPISGRKIIVYADFIDPFCYIALHTLIPIAETRKIELDWRGFEMNPETPADGFALETAANSDLRPGMWASVESLAKAAGLSFPEPRRVPNTRGAHALLGLAQKPDVKNPLIERIYQAYFMGQKDVGQKEVLIDLASAFGLSSSQVEAALSDTQLGTTLEKRRLEASGRRFLGLPGFVYKGQTHFGALSKDAWHKILDGGSCGH